MKKISQEQTEVTEAKWETTCPNCHQPGKKFSESLDYNCINPHCDVRTFRERRKK